MSLSFSVLASGSRGNASLVAMDGTALLIDAGLGPRALQQRLHRAGFRLDQLRGVLLTHTHGDHARDETFRFFARLGVRLTCHAAHEPDLARRPGFLSLRDAGLVRFYQDRPFLTLPGLWAEPVELLHSGPTFGFRLQSRLPGRKRPIGLGFITDTGSWTDAIADALADLDLLAVEFNHDVEMTRASDRSPFLIARNLGARGHLSNDQAAGLLEAVLQRSGRLAPRHVVLLHISQECNRVDLALSSARAALRRCGRRIPLLAAPQVDILPPLKLGWQRHPSISS